MTDGSFTRACRIQTESAWTNDNVDGRADLLAAIRSADARPVVVSHRCQPRTAPSHETVVVFARLETPVARGIGHHVRAWLSLFGIQISKS